MTFIAQSTLALFVPVPVLTAWVCYRAWKRASDRRAAYWIVGVVAAAGLSDGLALAALPRLGISFGPTELWWLLIAWARVELALGVLFLWRRILNKALAGAIVPLAGLNLAILAGVIYGFYIEPFNLSVTHVSIALPPTVDLPPLRIVHLSDLHVERTTKRERKVLATVERLKPDLILLTGDYLNWSYTGDETARRDARDLLRRLHAPYGVYAVPGTPVVDTEDAIEALFSDMGNVTLLEDEIARLDIAGQPVYLVGLANRELERDRASLRRLMSQLPPHAFAILMYHTPDLIETASGVGVDVYLAGHTHGGQIRLPGYGALVTSSSYGKRYESGLYQVGPTRLYVSRGIGMEGMEAPRVRFWCPPEIVEISLEQ